MTPLIDWLVASAATVLWLKNCTEPRAMARANGTTADESRLELDSALAAARTLDADPLRRSGPPITLMMPRTNNGPSSATEKINNSALEPAPAAATLPGRKAGRMHAPRPAAPKISPVTMRPRLSFAGPLSDSRSASTGSSFAGRRAAIAAAARAVSTQIRKAAIAGSGLYASAKSVGMTPASANCAPRNRASRNPGTAPIAAAVAATSNTSRPIMTWTCRVVAPIARNRANSRRLALIESDSVLETTNMLTINARPANVAQSTIN